MDIDTYWKSRPSRRVTVGNKALVFDCSTRMADFRARTALSKEPGTIAWLRRLPPGTILYDVGANVGVYAVYAAIVAGVSVYAFEPSGPSFGLLCRNVELNRLSGRVLPFCMGLSDKTGPTVLHLVAGEGGETGSAVRLAVNQRLVPSRFPMQQGILAMRGDDFAASPGVHPPHALKIDVDGLEHLVIDGFSAVIAGPTLKTVNIELTPSLQEHDLVAQRLLAAGFSVDEGLSFTHRDGLSRNVVFVRP